MGWKEMWEKYQVAAAFAEEGEFETARIIMKEASRENPLPAKKRPAAPEVPHGLRPSHAEG